MTVKIPTPGMGTHGFQLITWLMELGKFKLAVFWLFLCYIVTKVFEGGVVTFVLAIPGTIAFFIGLPVLFLVIGSYYIPGDNDPVDWNKWLDVKDPELKKQYEGKKIPYCTLYEAYMDEKIDFKMDFYEAFKARNKFARATFVKEDIVHYFDTFLVQNLGHSPFRDKNEVATVYDRGNDFYNFFLGEPMKYSCGIYRTPKDTLEEAQYRMLDLVCKQTQMKKGMDHLDFGCGWGTLVTFSAEKFGVTSYGVTLSKEQAKWGRERAQTHGVAGKVNIQVQDYRTILEEQPNWPKKYDVITCLEMAEHVGIKHFQNFLVQVRSMLKPNGIFYLQIAGLRRAWQYEDLVWGLFMNKYIFPAADASCPVGFVTSQLERAGWEVHRVENTGVHYSLTIKDWYYKWISRKDEIIPLYGVRYYRMWIVFLAWSTIVAGQGSSTVFMTTNTINHAVDKQTIDEGAVIDREAIFVGQEPIGLQQ